jgi:phosphatidylserine/phosphatidylglycerophosphate/cardiolipin synthase-like enzyme
MFRRGVAVGSIQPYFLAQGVKAAGSTDVATQAAVVKASRPAAQMIAEFIAKAKVSVHIAIYDFRLDDPSIEQIVVGAINDAARRKVTVRVAYDRTAMSDTLKNFEDSGGDPAPVGTHTFLTARGRFHPSVHVKAVKHASSAAIARGIDPKGQIMHHKYIVRDGETPRAAVLMGSTNFTIDAWALQENNMLVIERARALATHYEADFMEMWDSGVITGTGAGDGAKLTIGSVPLEVVYAPGDGATIDADIAKVIAGAQRRLYVASMVISSATVMGAITDRMDQVDQFGGIYDGTQMAGVETDWTKSRTDKKTGKRVPPSAASKAKYAAWAKIRPHLHVKASIGVDKNHPHRPHSFMHDKIAVADNTVVTGSFNFSANATHNAENVLIIRSAALSDQYAAYVCDLFKQYPRKGAR